MFARLRRQPHSGRCSKTVRIKRTPETADERFRSLLGRIARVPKAEVEKEEQKYQAAKRRTRQRQATDLSRRRSE